jgi:hypothetical protein
MNVRELIELLKQENPETEVVLTADNFEQGYPRKLAVGLFNFRGKIVRKPFRDAFDGERYDSAVVEYTGDENDQPFIELCT